MTPHHSPARIWAIVPAAGRGERFAVGTPSTPRKQYAPLAGATVIQWSLAPLLAEPAIERILVAVAQDDDLWPPLAARLGAGARLASCSGGDSRQESVLRALRVLSAWAAPRDWVLVHDAARPCLSGVDLRALLAALHDAPGAMLAAPVSDTLKRVGADGALDTVDRNGLWRALTPQVFRVQDLLRALTQAQAAGIAVTDESQAMERIGIAARLVPGSAANIKITRPEDLRAAQRNLWPAGRSAMRIGQGFDVHAFTDGDHVVLGGVRIAHRRAILAHSDGDVIIHALCDALLGALGQGDIGRHFPDSEPRWRGADSRLFLREVAGLVRAAGLRVVNADITVTAQAPRIAAHAAAMIANLSADLAVPAACLNIKATTTERLGYIGREEGLSAAAVVLLDAVDE